MPQHTKSVFDELGESLDISSLRILNRPKPDIFLCGGSDPNTSARPLFMQFAEQECSEFHSRLVLAEDVIKSWFRANNYDNLLELEKDLASIASIVPIFLESPGSFAEVGSFASNRELIKKILVFQDTKYKDAESFINLGPLNMIQKYSSTDDVLCYEWENIDKYFSDIMNNILEKLKVKEKAFYNKNIGDISILVLEILNMAQLAKKSDIKSTLDASGMEVIDSQLSKMFYILEKMGCIKEKQAGKSRYYTSLYKERMLSLAFKKSAKIRDHLEWRFRISQHYLETDRNWDKLWASMEGEGGAAK